mgnify:CR=1 FL=1
MQNQIKAVIYSYSIVHSVEGSGMTTRLRWSLKTPLRSAYTPSHVIA